MTQMSLATFDTLAAVRNLERAGMGTPQAEAVAETIRVAVFQGVATKEDLAESRVEQKADLTELRTEMKEDLAELRVEMKADIAELRTEMKEDLAELRAEMKADIAGLRAEMKADVGDLQTGLEALRADVEKVRGDLTWRMVLVFSTVLGVFTLLQTLFFG